MGIGESLIIGTRAQKHFLEGGEAESFLFKISNSGDGSKGKIFPKNRTFHPKKFKFIRTRGQPLHRFFLD